MKKLFTTIFSFICVIQLCAQETTPKIKYFDLKDITLLDSPFKRAQDLDKKYLLDLDADRLLAPFIREAGLQKKLRVTRTGKTQALMDTSEDIMFRLWL